MSLWLTGGKRDVEPKSPLLSQNTLNLNEDVEER